VENLSKKEKVKRFSCVKCGSPFDAHPPDDLHNTASLKEADVEDPIKVEYRCKDCGNINVIYWGYEKFYVGVA
jgi:rubredoxin